MIVNHGFQHSILIDTFMIDVDIPVGMAIPQPENYTGNASIAKISISFVVRCAEDYYGQDCAVFCPDFQNCSLCGLPEFSGEYCHLDASDCAGEVCGRNTVCVEELDGFACVCSPGFTGDNCDISIDHCANVTCSGNGDCLNMVDSFMCSCDSGYSGELCEQTETSLCSSTTCNGNGRCMEEENSFHCSCDHGFSGPLCEIKCMLSKELRFP